MRIVFFGTPDYVLPILSGLYKAYKVIDISPIAAVVTQHPKPSGRSKELKYSPVDTWAHKHGVPIYYESSKLIEENVKADLAILASYGEIIPKNVINYFPKGILVIHPSLLPQFRWSSPVPATIITGTNPTGLTIFKMDDKFDHGPIVSQFKEDVMPDDTYGILRDRLFEKSARFLIQTLPSYLNGKINLKPQDEAKASFSAMIKKEDAYIPGKFLEAAIEDKSVKPKWSMKFIKIDGKMFNLVPTPENVYAFIRAMDPWPGAWTNIVLNGEVKRLKIISVKINDDELTIEKVQLEGKKEVTWSQFMAGYPSFKFK